MGCGTCRHGAVAPPAPAQLFQIRRGYRAKWSNLAFSVEGGSGDWTLRVQDSAKQQTLYLAYRGGARAAKVAAAEFAIFLRLGPQSRMSPDRLANELNWQSYQ